MKNFTGPAWLAITSVLLALGSLPASVSAQGADEAVEEIVTIGTRRQGRTALDTAVPIDVFNQEDLDSVSSSDLIDVIKTLVPSFNVGRVPIGDGSTMVRPPTLRGLDADKTLVLINGKRRHRAALVVLGGFGSHGPDLATIPSMALKSVEVLRDGASALYGSDAIAGVMNFNLRDASEGGQIRMQYGVYSDTAGGPGGMGFGRRDSLDGQGGEKDYKVALNFGMPLTEDGFINVSSELYKAQGTSRGGRYEGGIQGWGSGQKPKQAAEVVSALYDHDGIASTAKVARMGPDALTHVYETTTTGANPQGTLLTIRNSSDGIPDDVDYRYRDNLCNAEIGAGDCNEMVWGEPTRDGIRVMVNSGITLSDSSEAYAFFNYSDTNADGSFYHRRPGISQFKLSRDQSGRIFNPRDRYPGGFTPRFHGNVIDESMTAGIRGDTNGWNYDFAGRYGNNEIRYILDNTINPSMGAASPQTFRPGNLINDEVAFNADFSKEFDVGMANDMNLAFGLEWREEGYEIVKGDTPSWTIGPYAAQDPWNFDVTAAEVAAGDTRAAGCYIPGLVATPGTQCDSEDPIFNALPVGSNGFPGYPAAYTGKYSRSSAAVYIDMEMDVSDEFLINVAARYEDYSDFGDNFSAKAAARYTVSDTLTVRASAGTGFRAPTPGQISTKNVSTRIDPNGQPVAEGIFPATNPLTAYLGAKPLEAETSTQFTLGISSTPTDNLVVTLDYYFIELNDRIVLSSDFAITAAVQAALTAASIPFQSDIAQVSYFTNDLTTETSGVDLVATYNMDWSGGNTVLSAAGNWNSTTVKDRVNRGTAASPVYFINDESKHDNEHGYPEYRMNISARHSMNNDVTVSVRGNLYGPYKNSKSGTLTSDDIVEYGRVAQWDADLSWDLSEAYRLTLGVNNLFDTMPDVDEGDGSCCGRSYRSGSVQDWQGTYYYVRGQISF
jgi:iron complex outermembrane receptor protein